MFMRNRKFDTGFSLLEVFIAIVVIAIAAGIAAPSLAAYYRNYKFNDYAYSMENLIRLSKIMAMERSINVGLCVDGDSKTISIIDMETNRSGICTGNILNALQIKDDFISLSGSGSAFDPRGFAIYKGNACVSNSSKYFKVVIDSFGAMRIEKGAGGCP